MQAFFAAKQDRYKQEEIERRQLLALKEYQGPREKALRLSDVKGVFREMMGVRHNEKPGIRPG